MPELQVDGLVGMTHNYAGLSVGNVASISHGGAVSHPRAAAIQGIDKMSFLTLLGVHQAVMPPHCRPDVDTLRSLGFSGTDRDVIEQAHNRDPLLLSQVCSASAMWTANAATVTASADAADGTVHLTPANLVSKFHRALEPSQTSRTLRAMFPDPKRFTHHRPLPGADQFADEGAANHTRMYSDHASANIFVYGREARNASARAPRVFPARQTLEASQAIARTHGVRDPIFVQQTPEVIDAGVFHNDVISVGTASVLLYHERAFLDSERFLDELQSRFDRPLTLLRVTDSMLSVQDAVQTYLFNSQLLETREGLVLIAPKEASDHAAANDVLKYWVDGPSPIENVFIRDLRESMQNGGGPACLRLRVPLTEDELESVHPGVLLTPTLEDHLRAWVERWYPEELHVSDLADPLLAVQVQDGLSELTDLLGLGPIYGFQD